MRCLLVLALVVLVGSCAGTGPVRGQRRQKGERAALVAADEAFAAATAERGLQGWMEYLGEQATIFPPGQPITTGIAAIRSHYLATGFDPQRLRWKPAGADVAASGDLGFTWGTWSLESEADGGAPVTLTGKYLTVWQKNAAGEWLVLADIGNDDRPSRPRP